MFDKCCVLTSESASHAVYSNVWSFRSAALPTFSLPVVKSSSIFSGVYSLCNGPPGVVSVVGQLQPLVHGYAGCPRPSPPLPPPIGGRVGGGGGCGLGESTERAAVLLFQRRLSHSLASTSASAAGSWASTFPIAAAEGTDMNAALSWSWDARSHRATLDQQLTAVQTAVQLLRVADEHKKTLFGEPTATKNIRSTATHDAMGDMEELLAFGIQVPGDAVQSAGASLPPPPQQQPKLLQQLLADFDHLALRQSLKLLQPLLPELSVAQLLRCLEALAVVKHVPDDAWFYDWILAVQQKLYAADATEVYGMLVAMRKLRLRPHFEWFSAAMLRLSAHLQQLDAVQVVNILTCFAEMALRPPSSLLAQALMLLQPDLPQLQPRLVLNLFQSCRRLRITPSTSVLGAAYQALNPAAVAVAPPLHLCLLTAAFADLRLKPPMGLLTTIVSRAENLLRAAVAADNGCPSRSSMDSGIPADRLSPREEVALAPAHGTHSSGHDAAADAGAGMQDSGGLVRPQRRRKARHQTFSAPTAAMTSSSVVAVSLSVAASVDVEHEGNDRLSSQPPDPALATPQVVQETFTPKQLSCLLIHLRSLEAPIPPHWGELCGVFLVRMSRPPTTCERVSALLRAAARCGLTLPPAAVRVVISRLEASLRAAMEERRRWQQLQMDRAPQRPEERRVWTAGAHDGGEDGDDPGWQAGAKTEKAAGGQEGDEGGTQPTSTNNRICEWTPQALAITAQALVPYVEFVRPSLLHTLYETLHDTLEHFDLPYLIATLHALPRLMTYPSSLRAAAGTSSGGHATVASPPPPAALISSYLSCLYGRIGRMQPFQLSMSINALLRLGARPDPVWMDVFLGQVYRKLPRFDEVQLTSVPWVVAKMSYRPQVGWINRVLSTAAGRLSCLSPRNLCQLLWAVGRMGHRADEAFMTRWLDKAQASFRTSDSTTLASMVWAVALVGHRPDSCWLQKFCAQFVQRLSYSSPRAVCNTLAALAALGHLPNPAWLEAIQQHVRSGLVLVMASSSPHHGSVAANAEERRCYSLREVSLVCYSLSKLGCQPPATWLDFVVAAAARLALQHPAASSAAVRLSDGPTSADMEAAAAAAHAKHIVLLNLSLARLRHRPPPAAWMAFLEGMYPCLLHAAPQTLALLLSSATMLRLPLPREYVGELLLTSHRRMGEFSAQDLSMIFRSFVELGVDPGPRWLARLEELLWKRHTALNGQQQQQQQPRRHDLCDDGEEEEVEEQVEEEEGMGRQEIEQPLYLQLSPRERMGMLWAATTLETARLVGPVQAVHAHASRRQNPSQSQQAVYSSATAFNSFDADGYPHAPRWVWEPGQRKGPLRLAGLIAALLSPLVGPTAGLQLPGHQTEKGTPLESKKSASVWTPHGDGRHGQTDEHAGQYRKCTVIDQAAPRYGHLDASNCGGRGPTCWNELMAYNGLNLSLLCWALGRLRLRPSGLIEVLLEEVSSRLLITARPYALRTETAGRCVPCTTTPGSAPDGAIQAEAVTEPVESAKLLAGSGAMEAPATAAASASGRGFAPDELAMVFWGLSGVGMWPTISWQALAAAAALRMVRNGGLSPRQTSILLLALARWRRMPRFRLRSLRRPPQRIHQIAAIGGRYRQGLGQQVQDEASREMGAQVHLRDLVSELGKLALGDSAARMWQPPTLVSERPLDAADGIRVGISLVDDQQHNYCGQSLAMLLWALASLGLERRLPAPWVSAFMPVSLQLLAELPPSQRVTMLDSLSRLGLQPGAAWIDKAEQVILQHGGGITERSSYEGLEKARKRMGY